MNSGIETAVFDEKFQINTVLEIDEKTEMPIKEKISKLTVCLDKSLGGTELGTAEVDMGTIATGNTTLLN